MTTSQPGRNSEDFLKGLVKPNRQDEKVQEHTGEPAESADETSAETPDETPAETPAGDATDDPAADDDERA